MNTINPEMIPLDTPILLMFTREVAPSRLFWSIARFAMRGAYDSIIS